MILSASRRTDIPCYYSAWLMNRLKAGYALTRNPMNYAQLTKIPLTPDVTDCIVFWTKDAANIMPALKTIDNMGYKYYFQFTLTPYDRMIEKNLRDKSDIENTFIALSGILGKERVLWRYDPIILNDFISIDYHREQFIRFCDRLYRYTDSVTISFADVYAKHPTKLVRGITGDEMTELGSFIGQTAKEYGLAAKACSEKADLASYGIEKASCIDKAVIEKICGFTLDLRADKNQREYCGCYESIDIGAYNTCLNGCVYCYANSGTSSTERRHSLHDPESELLAGSVGEGEKITERKVKTHKRNQIKLF
ncbi:MAG: DUF1848 domain-containing protein [Eubacteriales bacterium]